MILGWISVNVLSPIIEEMLSPAEGLGTLAAKVVRLNYQLLGNMTFEK